MSIVNYGVSNYYAGSQVSDRCLLNIIGHLFNLTKHCLIFVFIQIANPCRKIVAVLGAIRVMLDILDTAGHSDNAAMRKQHYRTADVVIIMYSVTNLQSFENVRQVNTDLKVRTLVKFAEMNYGMNL